MNLRKAFAAAATGAVLGGVLLPSAALAEVIVSPTVVRPGAEVTIWASCSPGVRGNAEITGVGQAYNVILESASDGARGNISAPTESGTYHVAVNCDGASAGSTSFTVSPSGGAQGGDGGSTDNTTMIATSVALLGIAAAGGFVLMRRRVHS